jgi:hypothetical protein
MQGLPSTCPDETREAAAIDRTAMNSREFLEAKTQISRRRRSRFKNQRVHRGRKVRRGGASEGGRGNRCSAGQHKNNRPGHNRILRMATSHAAIHRRFSPMMLATGHRRILRRIGIARTLLRRMTMQRAHRPIAACHPSSLQRRSPSRRPQQNHRNQTHTRPQPSSLSVGIVAHSLHFPEPKNTPPAATRKFNLPKPAQIRSGFQRWASPLVSCKSLSVLGIPGQNSPNVTCCGPHK